MNLKKIKDVCEIKPPKKESKQKLSDDDLVSFVPMNNLNILSKYLNLEQEKPLSNVYKGYVYFAENDVLLAKITPCFENGKLGIARNLKNGIGFGSSEYIVFRSKGQIDSDYFFYDFFLFINWRNKNLNRSNPIFSYSFSCCSI